MERLTVSRGPSVQSHVRDDARPRLVEAKHDTRLPTGLGAHTITRPDAHHLAIVRLTRRSISSSRSLRYAIHEATARDKQSDKEFGLS